MKTMDSKKNNIFARIADLDSILKNDEYLDRFSISKEHAKILIPEKYARLVKYLIPCIDSVTKEVDALWNKNETIYLYVYFKVITVKRFVNSRAFIMVMDSKDENYIRDSKGNSLLHLASKYGDHEAVDELIERGSSLSSKNSLDITPLHLAVKYNHDKVVQILLSNGVNIDSKDKNGHTPLYYAVEAQFDDVEVIRLLMEYGADAYIDGKRNSSPLILAMYIQRVDMIKVMLEYESKHVSCYGHALTYAKTIGNQEIIDLFEPPMNFYERLYYIMLSVLVVLSIVFMYIG